MLRQRLFKSQLSQSKIQLFIISRLFLKTSHFHRCTSWYLPFLPNKKLAFCKKYTSRDPTLQKLIQKNLRNINSFCTWNIFIHWFQFLVKPSLSEMSTFAYFNKLQINKSFQFQPDYLFNSNNPEDDLRSSIFVNQTKMWLWQTSFRFSAVWKGFRSIAHF